MPKVTFASTFIQTLKQRHKALITRYLALRGLVKEMNVPRHFPSRKDTAQEHQCGPSTPAPC